MLVTLKGKIAIVTGAASGIGLATAIKFLEADAASVVAVDLAPEPPADLSAVHGANRLRYVCGDVSLAETAQEFTRLALEAGGRIDILVNNAGVSVVKPLHEHTPEEWDRVMNTNVKAIYMDGGYTAQ